MSFGQENLKYPFFREATLRDLNNSTTLSKKGIGTIHFGRKRLRFFLQENLPNNLKKKKHDLLI